MKFSEAMKLLEEGKKVRRTDWDEGYYIYKGTENYIINSDDGVSVLEVAGEWEEYIEEGKDINVHSKIEELDEEKFMGLNDVARVRRLFYKLNEVIKELNRRK